MTDPDRLSPLILPQEFENIEEMVSKVTIKRFSGKEMDVPGMPGSTWTRQKRLQKPWSFG
jgi:hypothetical protein